MLEENVVIRCKQQDVQHVKVSHSFLGFNLEFGSSNILLNSNVTGFITVDCDHNLLSDLC